MTAVKGAKLVSGRLSRGEIVVQEAILPTGEKLYIVAFEYAGKLEQPGTRMEISLPMVLAEGERVTLLNSDGTETAVEYTASENATRVVLEYPKDAEGEENAVRVLYLR